MKPDEIVATVRSCMQKMNALYCEPVFDEWAIVSLGGAGGAIWAYEGGRPGEFRKNFLSDVEQLRAESASRKYGPGDFDFAREAHGTEFDAFMVLGSGTFLFCNHTARSMQEITRNPLWLRAQVPFFELSNLFREKPARS